jgi:putative peptidoglycan lipid II flippase
LPLKWGVAGLTISSGISGWVEFVLLRRSLNNRIGKTGLGLGYVAKLWAGASIGAAVGWGLRLVLGPRHPLIMAIVVLGSYGSVYFGVTSALGVGESRKVIKRLLRMARIG